RHAVEELAEPTGDAQLRLARKAVERARQVAEQTPDARAAHVGYHLIGRGRLAFEQSVAWVPNPKQRVRRLLFRYATPVYLGAILAGTTLLLAAAIAYGVRNGWYGTLLIVIALLGVVPASELTIQVLQRAIAWLIPPRRLARL